MSHPFEGGCACGRIRYRCDAEPIYHLICHCRDCQRASGSAFATVVFVPSDSFKLAGDEPHYHTVRSDSGSPMQRGFCRECGSPLLIKKPERPYLTLLQAASLDDPELFKPALEIFTSRAQHWTQSGNAIAKKADGPGAPLIEAIRCYFHGRPKA
jgi:hypothetical protein